MNQDQVKKLLTQIQQSDDDFTVLFTGKKSKKVDGLYKPDSREILIHNKNHADDNALLYTAIHEYAHHLQFTRLGNIQSGRIHNSIFWELFHSLIDKAEEIGIYKNVFKNDERFNDLTARIKQHILSQNGNLMLEFGKLLMEAHQLCIETRVSFEDFIDRCIGINRFAAKQAMRVFEMKINPEIGYDNMKVVASIRDETKRSEAEDAFLGGKRPEAVKALFGTKKQPESLLEVLLAEKTRTQETIDRLIEKLAKIEKKLKELKDEVT